MAARSGVRKTIFFILLFIAVILYLTLGRLIQNEATPGDTPPQLSELGVVVFPEPQAVETFSLIDQNGDRVAKPDLRGQWTVAFMGYGNCEQAACGEVFETLAGFGRDVEATTDTQPEFWFISVDPDRDNPEALREHLQAYELEARGVTGKREQLESLARSLKGAFSLGDPAAVDGSATIDFSGHLALISPNAELVAIAQQPVASRELAEAYRRLVAWYDN